MAAIKGEQLFDRSIAQRSGHARLEIAAHPGGTESFAFEAKESHFVIGIDGTESWIELDAVDDLHRPAKPDMFGPKIAMTLDDVTAAHARGEQIRAAIEKSPLHSVEPPNAAGRHAETRIEEYAPVIGEALFPIVQMDRGRKINRRSLAKKLGQRGDQAIELPSLDAVFGDTLIKHLLRVEPLHDNEPVNDRSASVDRQPIGRRHQRRHVEVDIGCEPPIPVSYTHLTLPTILLV